MAAAALAREHAKYVDLAKAPPSIHDHHSFGTEDAVLDAVMLGRAAYNNPWMFADADRRIFGVPNPGLSRREVIAEYLRYAEEVVAALPEPYVSMGNNRVFEVAKPLIQLFHGVTGGGKFRGAFARALTAATAGDKTHRMGALREALAVALPCIPDYILDQRPPVGPL